MEKYFEEMTLSEEELVTGIKAGLKDHQRRSRVLRRRYDRRRHAGSLLQAILDYVPAPDEVEGIDPNGPTAGLVFKTVSDQFGKYNFIKLVSGKLTADMSLRNSRTGNTDKLGRLYTMCGKEDHRGQDACCGDIVAIGKWTGRPATPCACDGRPDRASRHRDRGALLLHVASPPKTKGQDDKIANGLARLNWRTSPSRSSTTPRPTRWSLRRRRYPARRPLRQAEEPLRCRASLPAVPYREKIKAKVEAHGRHKKQTGGSGQFGDVWIRFEPQEESEMIFAEEVFGGSVPKNFFPAVEKGLRDAVQKGVLAGYPLVNLKATLYDGSYHR